MWKSGGREKVFDHLYYGQVKGMVNLGSESAEDRHFQSLFLHR